jgi:hypothetical protein
MSKHRVLQAPCMRSDLRLCPSEEDEEVDEFSNDADLSLPYSRRINLRKVIWQGTQYP